MNRFTLATIAFVLLVACSRSKVSVAEPTPRQDPCGEVGVRYSPVGRIVKMNEMPLKEHRDYGTYVLLDASGNVQWVLKSPTINLDPYADGRMWYRMYGEQSIEHSDLFEVCSVSMER